MIKLINWSWYFPPSYLSGFSKLPYLSSNCTSCCLYATKSKCTFLLHGWWTPTGMLSEFGVEILNVCRALAKNWRKNRAPFKLYYLIKYAVIKKIEFRVYETNWYLFKETHFLRKLQVTVFRCRTRSSYLNGPPFCTALLCTGRSLKCTNK